jgi:hypothetical protein
MMGFASLNPSYEFPLGESPSPQPSPRKSGAREKNHNPRTALVMMLRWISLEPP